MKRPSATSDLSLQQGDVVVVPFPYTDQLAEKRRPALVVSGNDFNRKHGLVWVAMITSAENAPWPGDVALPAGTSGLDAASVVRPAKLATIDGNRVLRAAGRVDAKTWQQVKAVVTDILR